MVWHVLADFTGAPRFCVERAGPRPGPLGAPRRREGTRGPAGPSPGVSTVKSRLCSFLINGSLRDCAGALGLTSFRLREWLGPATVVAAATVRRAYPLPSFPPHVSTCERELVLRPSPVCSVIRTSTSSRLSALSHYHARFIHVNYIIPRCDHCSAARSPGVGRGALAELPRCGEPLTVSVVTLSPPRPRQQAPPVFGLISRGETRPQLPSVCVCRVLVYA